MVELCLFGSKVTLATKKIAIISLKTIPTWPKARHLVGGPGSCQAHPHAFLQDLSRL